MKIAIMQPYFFPYIGYFQLMAAVDEFIIYDNIQFSKKGWIHRNRILVNGKDDFISLSLKKDSDFLDVRERVLAEIWPQERTKMLNRISEVYRKAPFFEGVFPVIERIILFDENNLFTFIFNSLTVLKNHLGIDTKFTVSSSIPIDHALKAEEKVLAICKAKSATIYLNPIGGVDLYEKDQFRATGIELSFLRAANVPYSQFQNEFIPYLSIIDVMMFNSKSEIVKMLDCFTLE